MIQTDSMRLQMRVVEKPWGRDHWPEWVVASTGQRIGEVHYENMEPQRDPLLVKYILTSDKLSIQVHPNDHQAQAEGLPYGKQECWYIIDCAEGAVIGIGLNQIMDRPTFEAACIDGSIESMIHWHPVRPGDFFFIPAGTVHAIGSDIVLAEIQQNVDITYRLYDYLRPRELHLAKGAAVSILESYSGKVLHEPIGRNYSLLPRGAAPFQVDLVHWVPGDQSVLPDSDRVWFLPLDGTGFVGKYPFQTGECWIISPQAHLQFDKPVNALLAYMTKAQG